MCTLWQIRLVVFVKPNLKNRVSQVRQGTVRTGIANALGKFGLFYTWPSCVTYLLSTRPGACTGGSKGPSTGP